MTERDKQFILKAGQFIVSKIDARYGAFGIAPNEVENAIITGNFWAYNVDKTKVNIEWFNQFTNSPDFYELCERASSGITHRKYLDEKFFLNYEINLPDIDEQLIQIDKIKAQKSSFQVLSLELSRQLSLVKQLRQSFLREAMQGKLVTQNPADGNAKDLLEQIKTERMNRNGALARSKKEKPLPAIKEEEIPFEIPENWVWCRFGELAINSEAGKSFRCIETPISSDEWGVVKVSAVSWDNFLEDKNKFYSKVQPDDISAKIKVGDFLISRANTSELVGKSVIVKNITKNLLLSDKTIRFNFSPLVSSEFINLCNNSRHARIYYSLKGTGSSPSMKNITRENMKELLIPLPPLPEQQRIVEKLDILMGMCDEMEQSIKASQEQNEKLLQQVLREALRG